MPMVSQRKNQKKAAPAPAVAPSKLSAAEIARVAFAAGFGKEHVEKGESLLGYLNPFDDPETVVALGNVNELRDAVAIALAESRGRVDAKGGPNSDGSYDLGLWQINTAAHVDKGFQFSAERLLSDPSYNAKAALQVYKERAARGVNGFEAWSAFRNKSYLAYVQRARLGLKKAGFFSGDFSVPSGGNWATELDEKLRNPLEGLPERIANALWPILLKLAVAGTGLALIGFGIKGLFGSSTAAEVAQKTAPVATGVAKGGSS